MSTKESTPAPLYDDMPDPSLAALFEHAMDGILITVPDGSILEVNPAACRIFGCSVEEIRRAGRNGLVDASDPRLADALETRHRTGRVHCEITMVRKDGSRFPAEITSSMFTGTGGRQRTIMIIRDVTKRYRAQAALAASEQQFREAFDLSAIPKCLTRPDGSFKRVNHAFCRMMGYPGNELPAHQTFAGITHPDDLAASQDLVKRMLSGATLTERLQKRYIRVDGRIVVADVSTVLLKDRAGQPQHFVTEIVDITARTEAIQTLSDQRAFLKSLLDAIPGPVFYKDRKGRYLGCNTAFEEFIGRTESEIVGKTAWDLAPAELAQEYEDRDGALFAAGRQIYESQVKRADGTLRNVIFHKAVFSHNDGPPDGLIGVIVDITEQRESERRFRHAQRLESIGTLAGGIAHDFNNILSAVIGFAELAGMAAADNAVLKDHIDEVLKAGRRAKQLVGQILAFSRQTETTLAPVQVHTIVNEALKLLRATLPATIEMDRQILTHAVVLADATQVHQIVMNLCTNAFHAMRDTGGRLSVVLDEVQINGGTDSGLPEGLPPGAYLRLSVADTGEGIPDHLRKHIFDPYFTTKREEEGTGLGLSVVHGIAVSHGGGVCVQSVPGSGSTFRVLIPLAPAMVDETDVETTAALRGGSERILVVDDESSIRKILTQVLSSAGYRVSVARNAQEGLALFRDGPEDVDLVITDMAMPGMPGDVMAQEMLRIRPGLPIIIGTGFSDRIDTNKARTLGARALIYKPYERNQLFDELRRILGNPDDD